MTGPEDAEARLDDLRRRLYRADATNGDVHRYLEELAAAPAPEPPAAPPDPRTASWRLALTLGIVVVLAAGSAVAVTARRGTPEASPPPSAAVVQVDAGDGRVVDGSSEGSVPVAASIDGTAVVGRRFEGYGNAVVEVDPTEGAASGGRAMVAVTSIDPTVVEWRALLLVPRTDGTSSPIVLAEGAAEDRSGAHASTTFGYTTEPPTRIAVEAPTGTGWTLVVAFTSRIAADLR